MRKAGITQKNIGKMLGFSQSTISKELSRNKGKRGYRPKQAHRTALERQASKKSRSRVIGGSVEAEVRRRLKMKHSPDQISHALRLETGCGPSRESIYSYIAADRKHGGYLYQNLRINGKRRYRRRNKANRSKIPNRIGIESRPKIVDMRCRYGDWEVDLIEVRNGSGYVLSVQERKSRLGILKKLANKKSKTVTAAMLVILKDSLVKTLTYDNGLEFAGHEKVTAVLGAPGYFCRPYHSWEKGGVENFNGLVRQYIPKGTDLGGISVTELTRIEKELNERPRKVLCYKSPSTLKHKLIA